MAAVDCGYGLIVSSPVERLSSASTQRICESSRSHKLSMSADNDDDIPTGIRAPIIGYEVVDRREKFTVYKVQVRDRGKSWFVFRRYTDFVRLNDKLEDSFPGFHFKLPAKRWFKNNFDPDFIEERAHGLQFFVNSILRHSSIRKSEIVKEFLCIDDPPGPFDSLEESRAYCQQLEDEVDNMKQVMMELSTELNATKSQLAQARVQQEALIQSLKRERASNIHRKTDSGVSGSFQSISKGQKASKEEDEVHHSSLMGNLEIEAQSESIHPIKPQAKTLLTSTPEKTSHYQTFQEVSDLSKAMTSSLSNNCDTQNDTFLQNTENQSEHSSLKELEGNFSNTDDEVSAIKSPDINNLKSQLSSKRDSGIVADTGLSPITTD